MVKFNAARLLQQMLAGNENDQFSGRECAAVLAYIAPTIKATNGYLQGDAITPDQFEAISSELKTLAGVLDVT